MGSISASFYRDLSSARRHQCEEAKPIVVQSITKAGTVSKMKGDAKYFNTTIEAAEYITQVQRLNPNLTLNFRITER
jgi:hypothetical protein